MTMLAMPTAGAQWQFAPSISAGLEYDDNPFLTFGPVFVSSIWGYALEADARISYNSQLTDFAVTPRYLGTRYDGNSELDSDEWFVDLIYGK